MCQIDLEGLNPLSRSISQDQEQDRAVVTAPPYTEHRQPRRLSVVVLVLALPGLRRAIPNIGQTVAMKTLLLALLFGLNLLGTPAMATEEPPFTVKSAQGEFEVREYPALVAAEVTVTGDRKDASSKGFRLLAGYIFGGNTRKQSIAMTAPVTQAATSEKIAMTAPVLQTGSNGNWVIRFIMPHGSTLETLPRPNNPNVNLVAIPAACMAVVKFSGLARQDDVDVKTAALSRFVKAQHLQPIGAPSLAQYDPPWTLWFMRRNEVMVAVSR